jgi:hypothetical protein
VQSPLRSSTSSSRSRGNLLNVTIYGVLGGAAVVSTHYFHRNRESAENVYNCRWARVQNQSEVSVRPSSYVQVKPGGDHDHSNATDDV